MESLPSSNEPRRPPWQFSVRGLLIFVLVCAAALADLRRHGGSWNLVSTDARLAISVWIVIGLLMQAWAFRRQLWDHELSADARWGLRFAIGWRLAVAVLLLGYHCVALIPPRVFMDEDTLQAAWWPDIVYYLALVVILSSVRHRNEQRSSLKARYLWHGVLWIVGGVYVSFVLYDVTAPTALVCIAIRDTIQHVIKVPPLDGLTEPAFWLGIVSAAFIPWNFASIYLAVRCTNSALLRLLWWALSAVGFCAMTSTFLWNYLVALPKAAPVTAEQRINGTVWHLLLIAAPCLLVLTTAAAYRWTAVSSDSGLGAKPASAVPRTACLHERWSLVTVLVVVLLMDLIYAVRRLLEQYELLWLFTVGSLPAFVAVCILAIQKTLTGLRHGPLPPVIPELPVKRFLTVWLATAATMLVAIPVLATYGFALWLAIRN